MRMRRSIFNRYEARVYNVIGLGLYVFQKIVYSLISSRWAVEGTLSLTTFLHRISIKLRLTGKYSFNLPILFQKTF